MFLDGPHVLQPADMAFGNSVESLEETGEAATEPEMAPRGWGFRATPENLEPGLVEALEVIRDVLLKDTYVVRAQSHLVCRVYARLISVFFFFFFFQMHRVSLGSAKELAWLRPSLRW